MQKREVKARLAAIKKCMVDVVKTSNDARNKRDGLYAQILSDLEQDHDQMVTLVRTSQYELIFDELMRSLDIDNGSDVM